MKLKHVAATALILVAAATTFAQDSLEKIVSSSNPQTEIVTNTTKNVNYPQNQIHYTQAELNALKIPHQSTPNANGKISIRSNDPRTNTKAFRNAKIKQINEAKKYDSLITRIDNDREKFLDIYNSANASDKAAVIDSARAYLEKTMLDEIFPTWTGTKWDFNGTSEHPMNIMNVDGTKGMIACGYFVSTTLQDAGMNFDRYVLARNPSSEIINYLSGKDQTRAAHRTIKQMGDKLDEKFGEEADGIYVLGLSCHTGFLLKKGDDLRFIHSSYMQPYGVVNEDANISRPIIGSRDLYLGKLFNDNMVKKWITDERVDVKEWK